jgi:hypothetical protein
MPSLLLWHPVPDPRLGDVFLPSPPPDWSNRPQRVRHTRQPLLQRTISSTREFVIGIGVGKQPAVPRVGRCIAEALFSFSSLTHTYRTFKHLKFSSIQERRRTKTRSITNPFGAICNPSPWAKEKQKQIHDRIMQAAGVIDFQNGGVRCVPYLLPWDCSFHGSAVWWGSGSGAVVGAEMGAKSGA